jgi:hypothetical protein
LVSTHHEESNDRARTDGLPSYSSDFELVRPDTVGADLLPKWIDGITACP